MTVFSGVDLSKLPAPQVIEELEVEAILADLKTRVAAAAPELSVVLGLESEPVVKLLQIWAYDVMILRARVNDAARAVLLAHASGSDLDQLAALFGVARLVIQEADDSVTPPIAEIRESDEAMRRRVQLALEGQSTAGPVGAYLFHAFSADGRILDVAISNPAAGEVAVTIYAEEADGTTTEDPVTAVEAALNADDVRPLTDLVTVSAAELAAFDITGQVTVDPGPNLAAIEAAARAALQEVLKAGRKIGRNFVLSQVIAALHVAGVRAVSITAPAGDVAVAAGEVAVVSEIDLTFVEAA